MSKGLREYLSLATAVAKWLWGLVRPVGGYIRATAVFYWQNGKTLRSGVWLWITDKLPALDRPEDIRRELRMPLADREGLRNVDGVWHVDLPDRCVMCGNEAPGAWLEEPRSALDPYLLLMVPFAGLAVGLVLAWWYSSWWWVGLLPCAGAVAGYALRRNELFLLRLKRCERHADHRRVPELAVLNRRLVMRLGTREVKLAFLRHEQEYVALGEMLPPPELTAESVPQTIALADSVAPDAAIIADRTELRLPASDERSGDEIP
ncbi:MAG: hypothetical protein EXS05_13745 [Planctomycetaceae bacterium]|nr:hypothetical protein [Planctomycetaceae bacterium]